MPWRDIADLGNVLRHAYHQVDVDILRNIAKDDLPSMKLVIARLIAEHQA